MAEEQKPPEQPQEPRPHELRSRKQRRGQQGTDDTHPVDESSEETEAGSVEKTSEPVEGTHVAAHESKTAPVPEQRPAQKKEKHGAVESAAPKITHRVELMRFRRRRKP
jgi:hypothetical protein